MRGSKERKRIQKNSLEESLQEYACEQAIKSDFSMGIAHNIGVES